MKLSILSGIFLLPAISFSQNIIVLPYLQDAYPTSIHILWETDSGEESIVEWGLTDTLGQTAIGISYTSNSGAQIHDVFITPLKRFTKYYYRVRTGNTVSAIFSFKTPPFASDRESFRMVAMSDMQRDGQFPNKFQEIVEDGVMTYLENEFGGEIIDNLALILIPGDLVQDGNNYASWRSTFFNPAENLFSQVPIYPVLGNHENNSPYYFLYFKLPENGTSGFLDHWWYKDHGNVRIIGLNSNGVYAGAAQLAWLDELLSATCTADSIDFVFCSITPSV